MTASPRDLLIPALLAFLGACTLAQAHDHHAYGPPGYGWYPTLPSVVIPPVVLPLPTIVLPPPPVVAFPPPFVVGPPVWGAYRPYHGGHHGWHHHGHGHGHGHH